MSEILLPLITTVVGIAGTLGAIYLKSYLEQKSKTKNKGKIEVCIDDDYKILTGLDELLTELDADRITIYSFHNGGEFYSGKSMQKMSISYEVVGRGISRNHLKTQNIPVSASLTTLKPLVEDKEFHIVDVAKDYPEGLCKYHLEEEGTKSTYQWALIDLNSNLIGMLRVDFVKDHVQLSKTKLKSALVSVIKLPGYLVNKK